MLRQRVITALVLVAVLLPTLFTQSAWPFSLFALVLASAGAWEWARLNGWSGARALAYAAAMVLAAALSATQDLPTGPHALAWMWLTVLWVVACVLLMPQGPRGWLQLPQAVRLASGLIVMYSTWLALTLARGVGVNFMLSVMCIVWVSDVSAYFAGHRWGRRKLAPTLSPGKTWEGVAGACVGVLLLAVLWMWAERQFDLGAPSVFARSLQDFGVHGLIFVVTALVALGVLGDLFESMIKRAVGAKDSSGLLPGHGGVLDRVDALLPVLPAAMAVLALGGKMNRKLRLAVLGSTGSIGTSTLDVAARHPDDIEVRALTAHSRVDELIAQCLKWRPRLAVVTDASRAAHVRERLRQAGCVTEVLEGPQALCDVAADPEVDAVMAAVVGAAGLPSCLAAARAGKRLLLANKEALVVGGAVFMQAVRQGGATLIPIDSEHSAIFQCLPEDRGTWSQRVDHIILTASGGPFRQRDPQSLEAVTPEEACAHPTWVMGRKISVDSATMMNKALEVIEARWLFDLEPERIRAVIHPQSIVHSMVVCRDQSVLAQLGTPDMRVPIAYGLAWPQRIESGASALDWTSMKALTFEEADERRFPGLFLSWHALRGPLGSTAVLNAANEVAVERFLAGRIGFMDIYRLNARALNEIEPRLMKDAGLDDLIALDQGVRTQVGRWADARSV